MTIFSSRPQSWPKNYTPPANPRLVFTSRPKRVTR